MNYFETNLNTTPAQCKRDDLVLVTLTLFSRSHRLWDCQKSMCPLGYFKLQKEYFISPDILSVISFSSPEHKGLIVSYFNRSISIVRFVSSVVHREASTICYK